MVSSNALLPAGVALGAVGLLVPSVKLKVAALGGSALALAAWWRARGFGYASAAADAIGGGAVALSNIPHELAQMNEKGVNYALSDAGKAGQQMLEQEELIRDLERKIALDVAQTGTAHPTKVALLARYKRNLATMRANYGK